MFDLIAVGELLIDFTPESAPGAPKPLYSQNPGGAPGNVLAAAAALGARTALVSRVGDDAFGQFLISAAAAQGIDTAHISRDRDIHTTLAFVHLDETGDRSFSFYRNPGADLALAPEHIPAQLFPQARIFHFGSVSMTGAPARAATFHALDLARRAGCLVSYDPNWRPSLWAGQAEALEVMRRPLPQVDVLKVSQEELPLLSGTDDLAEGSRRLCEQGPALVLVSLGAQGAFWRLGTMTGRRKGYRVATVDTTGAGDAFLGAALWQLRGLNRAQLEGLSPSALAEIVDFANAAGALATTRKGSFSVMPLPAEIDSLRAQGPAKEDV